MSDIEEAKRVLNIEAQSILGLIDLLNGDFEQAVSLIAGCQGKVVVTGIGKSGHIARKLASTFSSTGTPALFLHPAESNHGDLGVIASQDVVVALSYGGEVAEMAGLLKHVARKNVPLLALSGKSDSTLARSAQIFLSVAVQQEACPLGLAPTSSSTATLAMGDALAMAVLKRKGFEKQHFAEFHPGGSLGRRLLTRVSDVMHSGDAVPLVALSEEMVRVIALMTAKEVRGVAGVVDDNDRLMGIITDGDIRRHLERNQNPLEARAEELMSRNPKTIDANEMAEKALFVMEQFRIQTLFVIDKNTEKPHRPIGLLHLQDLLQSNIR